MWTPEALLAEQVKLEEQMVLDGADRYMRNVNRNRERGMEDKLDYSKRIIGAKTEALANAIEEWKQAMAAGHASHRGIAYRYIHDMDNKVLAYLTLKAVLAGITKPRTLQMVTISIGTTVEDEKRLAAIRDTEKKSFNRIVEKASERASDNNKHYYAVRAAREVDDWEEWGKQDRLHIGMRLLDIMMQTVGLVEVFMQKHSATTGAKYIRATAETVEWIEKRVEVAQYFRPVFEPMVVPPKPWTNVRDGGYLTSFIKPLCLVKFSRVSKEYIEQLGSVEMPVVYEAVNALQNTAWSINSKVLDVMQTLWEAGANLPCLPLRNGLPMPTKPHDIDTNKMAQRDYRSAAAKIHMLNLSHMGQRIGFNYTVRQARRFEAYPELYFPYQLDFRGRIYAVPHLNPQGPDNMKGLLQFAKGTPLGKDGAKWLAFHGANVAGNDKCSIDERVQWVLENEEAILACAENPLDNLEWTTTLGGVEIDKPFQFLAFCFEWAGYRREGEAYESRIPVALDGSCSGIQHFSAMLKDERGGAAVNLTPAKLPQDVYRMVAEEVIKMAEVDAVSGTPDEPMSRTDEATGEVYEWVRDGSKSAAQAWLKFGITRKVTKRSVMTLAYGSKEYGFRDQLMTDIIGPAKTAAMRPDGTTDTEKFPFSGDGYGAALYMSKLIWIAVNRVLVKAGEAMEWLQDAAKLLGQEGLPVRWTTVVGFPVMQAYYNTERKNVKTALYGKTFLTTLHREVDGIDKRAQSQAVSPNFVHSCDAAHLMLTVVRCTQQGINQFAMIHDSFGTTAGRTEEMFTTVRESFVEIYDEIDVLENFREEVAEQLSDKRLKKLRPLPLKGTLDVKGILESKYAFS